MLNCFNESTRVLQLQNLDSSDTSVYVDNLLPGKLYNFKAIVTNNEQEDTSSQLPVTTLDTTSHNFTFDTFEFGDPLTGYSSLLYDCAIISENNIWCWVKYI